MDWNTYSCQKQQQSRVDHERQVDYAEQVQQQKSRNESVRYHMERDERHFQDHLDQAQHEREDMAQHQHDRSVTEELDRRFEAREDHQIEEQVQKVLDRSFHATQEKQHHLDEKTARNDVVCEQMVHNQEEQNDRDDARTERHQREDSARNDQDDMDRREDSAQSIRELTAGLDGQVEYKRVVAVEQKAEDVRFKEASDLILAAGDARELEEKRKTRERNLAYSEDLRKQIEEDKVRKLAEKNSYNAWTGYY